MRTRKTLASALIVGLALINWVPIEEVSKATRLLPDNFFSSRSEIQFIDQEIRGAVRRYARSEERDNGNQHSPEISTEVAILNEVFSRTSTDAANTRVRIQNYLNKSFE
jgi:hypothetical protein